ncbi:THAP domain-containing protein 4-like [Anoplophora glabripennis]|uniref:THAP domain-containing protein 4-like n=1 Tax=Anoplophora glabripennis TaxID=217634 RepID=UPI0008740A1A|nr:THAP domain-containing protein 4-like [Anoplophora glabripennis]
MGKKCSLKNCKNYQKEPSYGCDISFHGIPRNEETRKKWLEAIPKHLIRENASSIYICGVHFTPESFQPASLGLTKNMLRRTAVPSIFDDVIETTKTSTKKASADKNVLGMVQASAEATKVNFVNASDMCVYVITKTESPVVQPEGETTQLATPEGHGLKKTCDVGIQVSLPTNRERELQRKLYTLQKRLERREARISSIMTDFKTLMDQS